MLVLSALFYSLTIVWDHFVDQFSFTDEIALAYRIGNVADALIEESPNRNGTWKESTYASVKCRAPTNFSPRHPTSALKARLVLELTGTLKAFSESPQSVVSDFPEMYNAAMCAGDVPTAMNVRRLVSSLFAPLLLRSFFGSTYLAVCTLSFAPRTSSRAILSSLSGSITLTVSS